MRIIGIKQRPGRGCAFIHKRNIRPSWKRLAPLGASDLDIDKMKVRVHTATESFVY
jgi:hypothetical protein